MWTHTISLLTLVLGVRRIHDDAECRAKRATGADMISGSSSEPDYVTIGDGSDRDWRLISMFELKKLEHAINEECVGKNDGCPPGHLKEMHDSGNEVIDKVRSRLRRHLRNKESFCISPGYWCDQ